MKPISLLWPLFAALLWVLGSISPLQGQSYQWSNFVGSPGGVGNVDGTGTAARFNFPRSIAVDASGNVYVADTFSHTIRKITKTGVVTTFAGAANQLGSADGTAANARFNQPYGVAVGSGGVVYVSDANNNTIRKITSAGVVTTLAGNAQEGGGTADGTGSNARFDGPAGLAVAADGSIYVADGDNHAIRKVTAAGVVTTVAGLPGTQGSADGAAADARFYYPQGVAVDGSGNLFVVDSGNCTVRKITKAGVVSTLAGTVGVYGGVDGTGTAAQFDYPTGIVVRQNGDLYVASGYNGCVRIVTQAGVVTTFAGTINQWGNVDATGIAARFSDCYAIAVDSTGNFYVSDDDNQNIRKITAAGVVTTLAGQAPHKGKTDGAGSDALFNSTQGVSIGPNGELYIADAYNNMIRKATPGGDVTAFAGTGAFGSANGTAATATFKYVYDTAADAAGNVYVADALNNVIRKIAVNGDVTTHAGTVGAYGNMDGMGSAAKFRNPSGIVATADGTLYVADPADCTVRKITPAGEVTTLAGTPGVSGYLDSTGTAARFSAVQDVAVDVAGNVYVADMYNQVIRKITSGGVVSTLAGKYGISGSADGTGDEARFFYPYGVAVDPFGNILVCDSGNNTIRKVTPEGVVTTIGGLAPKGDAVNGLGTAARFSTPYRVAIGNDGLVYVADKNNNRIMKGVPLPEISVEQPAGTALSDGHPAWILAKSGSP